MIQARFKNLGISQPSLFRPWDLSRVHHIGIGGSGMCALAEILLDLGYEVTGSDARESETLRRLQTRGGKVALGHHEENVAGADMVVFSHAIRSDNPELQAARAAGVPVISRAEMLGELARLFPRTIVVAGSHGKSTSAALATCIFRQAGLHPSFAVGGLVKELAAHGGISGGERFVVEADESDSSFTHLQPVQGLITNIDREHMDAFGHSLHKLDRAFLRLLRKIPFHGMASLCGDDPGVARILQELSCPVQSYGFAEGNDFVATDLEITNSGSSFLAHRPPPHVDIRVTSPLLGKHNVLNILGVIALATSEGVSAEDIRDGIAGYSGVSRRMTWHRDLLLDGKRVDLLDDYGHHPTEIRVVIETLRWVWPERRLVMVFQPHRYSRTRDLYEDFVTVLNGVDVLLVSDLYPAGETPILGAGGHDLCRSIRSRMRIDPLEVSGPEEAHLVLGEICRPGDIIIVQGAGDIASLTDLLIQGGGDAV